MKKIDEITVPFTAEQLIELLIKNVPQLSHLDPEKVKGSVTISVNYGASTETFNGNDEIGFARLKFIE